MEAPQCRQESEPSVSRAEKFPDEKGADDGALAGSERKVEVVKCTPGRILFTRRAKSAPSSCAGRSAPDPRCLLLESEVVLATRAPSVTIAAQVLRALHPLHQSGGAGCLRGRCGGGRERVPELHCSECVWTELARAAALGVSSTPHCISMCATLVGAGCARKGSWSAGESSFLYVAGRTMGYGALGLVVGAFGSTAPIAPLRPWLRASTELIVAFSLAKCGV